MIYEVLTWYKSGRQRTETIAANNEKSMWNLYDERHKRRKQLIEDTAIIDLWIE